MTATAMVPHHRQFVIGPAPAKLAENWLTMPLPFGLWLSHCPNLRLATSSSESTSWVLIGLAVQSVPGALDPVEQLQRCLRHDIDDMTHDWAGRWLLIGGGEIHLDATGQLGCLWTRDPDGRIWTSSSPAAMATISGVGPQLGHRLRYEQGLSWVVPPVGHRQGVQRLLPSRILNLRSGQVRPRALVPAKTLGTDDPVAALAETLTESVRRLPENQPIHVALTAGADSRAVLAAALAADRPVNLFTRRSARMAVYDRLIPPALAKAVGLDHGELVPVPGNPDRWPLVIAHCDGAVAKADVQPLLDRGRDRLRGIEVGGQGFGVGKATNRAFPPHLDDVEHVAEVVADLVGEPSQSANRRSLALWLADVVDDQRAGLNPDLDWRDRYYMEQRMAGWQAAKEQVYDLHGHQRFFPINSARAYGLLLACDEQERGRGRHQLDLIELLDSRLAVQPVNPGSSHYRWPTRARHLWAVDRRGAPQRIAAKIRQRLVGHG